MHINIHTHRSNIQIFLFWNLCFRSELGDLASTVEYCSYRKDNMFVDT